METYKESWVCIMKKWHKTLAAAIAVSTAVSFFATGCKKKTSDDTSTDTESSQTTSETQKPTDTEPSATPTPTPAPTGFQFTKDNYPVIDGSTSTKPMATSITSVMLGIPRSDADDMLTFHKTTQSFRYLMDGEADMLICAQPADSVIETMKEENFEYEMEPFSAEALVFVVNVNNPVESLTVEQIQKIYTGEIKNWKEVGGEDKEIVAVQRNKEAGSQVMMEKLVMGDLEMMNAPEELMPGDMGGLIQVVKSYDNSSGAIGYTPYYYAKNMKMADGLKILKVDGVMPENSSIAKGDYPFRTSYYAVIPKSTPADAPARILFNWILGEEGQKLAEMEGYVPAASGNAPMNTIDVVVDWTAYQPAEAADPVFTRLKDEEIPDFIPASDYGRIFPYTGSLKEGYGSWSTKQGFFDISGRVICDPVYDALYNTESGAFIVKQYIVDDDPNTPDVKIGVISQDGSKYTGLKFTEYFYRQDGGLSLAEPVSDGIKVYPYDESSDMLGTPKHYVFDRSHEVKDSDVYLRGIINDRYVVYVDEYEAHGYVYDGQTGKQVFFPTGTTVIEIYGNILHAYSENAAGMLFFDVTGKEIDLGKAYEFANQYDENTILFSDYTNKVWDIRDADGNLKASLSYAKDKVDEINRQGNYFIAKTSDSLKMYDDQFNLIKSYTVSAVQDYTSVDFCGDNYSYRFSTNTTDEILQYCINSGKTKILNMMTGKDVVLDGEYHIVAVPGYLILNDINFTSDADQTWKILDASDYHMIAEGDGQYDVYEDWKDHKYYMAVSDAYWSEKLTVIEVATGKTVWEDLPNPRNHYLYVTYIYDGKLVYSTLHRYASYEVACSSTTMVDKEGKVLFLINTVYLPGD